MDWLSPLKESMPKMQSLLAKQVAARQKQELMDSLGDAEAADVNSNGGPGAGAYLLPTPHDAEVPAQPDSHFRVNLRDRLLMSVCPAGATCRHRRSDGTLCGAPLDSRGKHAIKCVVQGLKIKQHHTLRDWGAKTWKDCSGMPTQTEQHVPAWDRINPQSGRLEEAVLDIASADPATGGPLFFDVCVYTAHSDNASLLQSRARHPGKAAADAASDKRRRYAQAGASLQPLPLEAGGRPGEDFISFVRRCGSMWEANHPGEASPIPRLWYEASSLLRVANAELILSAVGK